MAKIAAPDSLGVAGCALWARITEKYDLRPDELAVLEGACRAADMIATLGDSWDGEPYTKGSMGQLVEHPAPKAMRAWQSAQDSALARLKLPDLPAEGAESAPVAPNQHRAAAQSKWAAAHGAGA